LTASPSDVGGSGIAQVVFKNGTTTIGTVTSAPYTLTLPLSTFNPGNNVLSILVRDKAGNEQASSTTSFVTNSVSLTATFTGSIINFSFPSTGETPASAKIECTKNNNGMITRSPNIEGVNYYQWTWESSDAGTYSCTVSTYKNNGTPLAVSLPITFTLAVD
jgi:hypothetical protein